ncbi:hypothetical protein [Novosphingobium sp. KN65.2]|uniref:hypothetical protein n=1 Tax=Novosphingobium sp. KN65.2 TaxID=1478134 RepID=UPI0005E27600|nr:hypothetical protein [Novosphingobium sp. KN65.2]CDO35827.1 exported hypothetical protein [Novosphingobium sp. KN65.2]
MKLEDVVLWICSLLASMAMVGARLGWLLYGVAPEPPADPAALGLWERKRRWLIFSEFSALPAFATIAVGVGRLKGWPDWGVVIFTMVLGALGFAFALDALQTVFRRRLGLREDGKDGAA